LPNDELQIVSTVANEFEADLVIGLLTDAGIHAFQRLSGAGVAGRFGGGGDVLVAESDLERARAVLDEQNEQDSSP
jgi:Putative prokaryotic signal transducing protein